MLDLRRLKKLAEKLDEYDNDPQFNLAELERNLTGSIGNKILSAKKHLLNKLLRHPEGLGNVLAEMLEPGHL